MMGSVAKARTGKLTPAFCYGACAAVAASVMAASADVEVRLVGRITGVTPDARVTVRYGYGPRITFMDRYRQETGSKLVPFPAENIVLGIEVPKTSSRWEVTEVAGDGAFATAWFPATAAPQLVVFDSSKRFAVRDIPLPLDADRRHTIDLGEIALQEPAGVEVKVPYPPAEAASKVLVGIKSATINEGREQQAGLLLSVLDRINDDVAKLVTRRGYYMLKSGDSGRIAPLPDGVELRLYARGPLPGRVGRRTVSTDAGGLSSVDFEATELFSVDPPMVAFSGDITLDGTDVAVAGAKVVARAHAFEKEVDVDDNGRFSFDGVPADRIVKFYVEATDATGQKRYDYADVAGVGRLLKEKKAYPNRWSIPATRRFVIGVSKEGLSREDGYPIFQAERQDADGVWRQQKLEDISFRGNQVEFTVSRPGTWRGVIYEGPFRRRYTDTAVFSRDQYDKDGPVTVQAAREPRDEVRVRLLDNDGKPITNAAARVMSDADNLYPVQVTTDDAGYIQLKDVNVEALNVQIQRQGAIQHQRVLLHKDADASVQFQTPKQRPPRQFNLKQLQLPPMEKQDTGQWIRQQQGPWQRHRIQTDSQDSN